MRSFKLVAAAALLASAFPLMAASTAMAQVKSAGPEGGGARMGGGGGGGGARMGGGGAVKGPDIGGGGPRPGWSGGGGGPRPGWSGGGPRPGWSGGGPRPGWSGGHGHRPGYGYGYGYGRRWVGPGIGFGTGLLLGGALAQPYYGGPTYYDDDYDDAYVYAAPQGDANDAYCRQRYRSYDPRTRTYLNNDGNRYPCP